MTDRDSEDGEESELAVNRFRIVQLEDQIKTLEKGAETLNLGQIKQMLIYLGLPVAIATGVFGLALWQTIETSAGNRAAREVQLIAGDIERLEATSTQMARDAAVRFGDLREIAGRADEAARAVRTRADEARTQATEAERLLARMREDLASVPEIQTLLQDTGSIANDLSTNSTFQNTVASAVLESLAGSVIAFDKKCPTDLGWVPFDPGHGRMIIGVGSTQDERGETRTFSDAELTGGEFQHELTRAEMPSHDHKVGAPNGDPLRFQTYQFGGSGRSAQLLHRNGSDFIDYYRAQESGESLPHNNMPPFITLYFCKKEIR